MLTLKHWMRLAPTALRACAAAALFPFSSFAAEQTTPTAPTAPNLSVNLSRAIHLAMEQNLSIKVESFQPNLGDARVRTQEGVFDPELQGDFTQRMTRNADGSENRQGSFSLGLGGQTSLGSDYKLGLSTTAFDYDSYRSGAEFSLTQPLLRGFGTGVNLAQLRIARNGREIGEWTLRQQIIDVIARTVTVYNALYAAQQNLEAARRSRDSALQLERDERQRVAVGVKTALDVTTAQAEAASREEAVILAESDIRQNERFLKQLITDDVKTLLATRITISTPATPAVGEVNVDAGLRDALILRPDYQQAILELKNRRINVIVTKNGTLPRLDLAGSLNLIGVSEAEASNSFNFFNGGRGNPQSWSAGAVLRLPLENTQARGRYREARLLDAQSLVALHRLEQQIIVEVANAAEDITTARKRMATTREALRLAKESLAAGEERLKAGTATTFEVLDLQQKLAKAEAAEIKAQGDFRNAVAEYERKTGTSIARNGVVIEQVPANPQTKAK